jgi:hypothetical protein
MLFLRMNAGNPAHLWRLATGGEPWRFRSPPLGAFAHSSPSVEGPTLAETCVSRVCRGLDPSDQQNEQLREIHLQLL